MTPPIADLEQYLAIAAYLVVRHGDAYVPTFERMERIVDDARRRVGDRERAHQVLASLMKREVTIAQAV